MLKLILAFYGCGKTTLVKTNKEVADLTDMGQPSLSLLQRTITKHQIVMADPSWTKVFLDSGLPFIVVVPSLDRKDEFLANYRQRHKEGTGGGGDGFCEVIGSNWEFLIEGLSGIPSQCLVELGPGEWLSDVASQLSPNPND